MLIVDQIACLDMANSKELYLGMMAGGICKIDFDDLGQVKECKQIHSSIF